MITRLFTTLSDDRIMAIVIVILMILIIDVTANDDDVDIQVGRIIGKGGGNVREMQRLTGAVIKLPEQVFASSKSCSVSKSKNQKRHSNSRAQGTSTGEETSVHIIGPFYSTQSAQRRIRAMVAGPPGGVPPNQVLPLRA